MTRARMMLGYSVAVVVVVWAAGMGHTGDHREPECGKTVCAPVAYQKKVTTKSYSTKVEEFCLTPFRGLFGQTQCGPVHTKRVLVLHKHTNEVPSTKYIPVIQCPQPACPPANTEQPAPGAGQNFMPPLGTTPGQMPLGPPPSGQFPQ